MKMSLSPNNILQRLQELKLWQESHEELLKKTKSLANTSANVTNISDYQTIQGLSAFDSTMEENSSKTVLNWDSQAISPTKTFNELLEESLAQDLGPTEVSNKPKKPFLKKGSGLERFRMKPNRKPLTKITKTRAKTKVIDNKKNDSNVTPLRAPDLSVKSKATWCKADNESDHIRKINEMTQLNTQIPEPSEQTLYEKALEKELLIFEALEQKAEDSSFCSTNSSVMRILSSTPSKINKELQPPPIIEEKRVHWKPQSDDEDEIIECSLEKKDIAEIILRLQSLAENNMKTKNIPSLDEVSDDEKSSTTETSSHDTSISSTDLEVTLRSEKRDVAVGTNSEESENGCVNCRGKLDRIISEYEKKIHDVIQDKNQISEIKRELEQKKDLLERDYRKMRKEFEDEKTSLLFDLENEKKKMIKEKQIYQMYIKDSQNRPTKKEREEISNLKQEVADLKETLKLKESKNGMTQARLRNQIKQLEKDNANLKDEVEKLTKENAKLSASQKLKRRPSDTKILHEINKNVSKLAQETLKNKGESGEENSDRLSLKHNKKDSKDDSLIEMVKSPNYANMEKRNNNHLFENSRKENKEDSFIEMTNSRDVENLEKVEKQYENTFHNTFQHESRRIDIVESILENGSKQIKYPNGNVKTISPDGNFITLKYFNGDIQETYLLDGVVKYYFFDKKIWQTTYADGSELLDFPDGITEKRYCDGRREVTLPDNVVQIFLPDGSQEVQYPDGSVINIKNNGEKVLLLPNGQKEIETNEHKRREYPDGTVKILYPDGTQETRYANGRVRIRDGNGTLIVDSQP